MKKLLLVALFVAVPALVFAQGTTTTTTNPTKAPAAKAESTTSTTTSAAKSATTTPTTPEMILVGEITNVDNTNKYFTLKVKDTNKTEKVSFREIDPKLKSGLKVKATYEKDASGNLWLKNYVEHSFTTTTPAPTK